jgi:hypothetical protein
MTSKRLPSKPQREHHEDVQQILANLVVAKQQKEIWEAMEDAAEAQLLDSCELLDLDSVQFIDEETGELYIGKVVAPELTSVDDDGLLNAVPSNIREQIENVKITANKKAVEVLVERGDLDPKIVREFTTIKDAKKYIKITKKSTAV